MCSVSATGSRVRVESHDDHASCFMTHGDAALLVAICQGAQLDGVIHASKQEPVPQELSHDSFGHIISSLSLQKLLWFTMSKTRQVVMVLPSSSKRFRFSPSAMATSALDLASNNSIFTKLPIEIRLMIYDLLLVSDKPIPITYRPTIYRNRSTSDSRETLHCLPARSIAILKVCKQIYKEAETILYKSNSFFFARPGQDLGVFLTSISEQAYTSITSLALRYPLGDRYTVDLLAGCQNLNDVVFFGNRGLISGNWHTEDWLIGLRSRKEIAYVQEFEKTPKYLVPYLEGLRFQPFKFCPSAALLRTRTDTSRSMHWTEITEPGNWREAPRLTPSQMSFKELVTGRGCERTQAQQKRATETRGCKVWKINPY